MTDDRVKVFVVPDLGEGLEEVTLTRWQVAVGDDVELNQPLCSVETAKAEVEIPSPYAGRIVEIRGAAGEVLSVGSLLARIDSEPPATNGHRKPVLVGYGADDALDTSRRRPKAKPSVRKLAADLQVDLNDVPPGADGLVGRDAVLAAAGVGAERPGVSYDILPVRGVHLQMAKRMSLSRSTVPDAHASVDVDGSALLRLRDEVFSPFVLTLRLLVIALSHNKILNSTWAEGVDGAQVRSHHAINLGFAVATPRGLVVPVIADAQDMTTRQLAECVSRLTLNARAGTLTPAELTGSTFTVSNFGALGLDQGVPVINYPEAAILGMGSLKPRAVVVDDAVVIRPQMTLTCAFDHRIADGANVAQFLCELRELVEAPETALLDL